MNFVAVYRLFIAGFLLLVSCERNRTDDQFQRELQSIDISRGDIALCGSGEGQYGTVDFSLSCSESTRANFNLATALLHSFEYGEAEKVFAKVIDEDPDCLMAYWGVAMSNFHPLWAPPSEQELDKGSKTISLARTIESKSGRESDYLEAAATLYDEWKTLDHFARLLKFEQAAERLYQKYPSDNEAKIFYALALRAASDPQDKTFAKQRKAGEILSQMFAGQPDHPGIAHYLIHVYDYPELADLALPAARKYASIASASAHALHMPSHIFTRLGLWDESVKSNINSMAAAKCYAENSGIQGHWDEELHGLDYLVYAYLQQGRDESARGQLDYLGTMLSVFPLNNKDAYTMAAVPTRYALERKRWDEAAALQLMPANFPWAEYSWERSIVSFGRVLGAVHTNKPDVAKASLEELKKNRAELTDAKKTYEANQVLIQIKASEAWMKFYAGDKKGGIAMMTEAATLEDATEKHPVTPGEVIPARELLGDMYMELGEYNNALAAYEADLQRHHGRFNGLYGAAVSAKKAGYNEKAAKYFQQFKDLARRSEGKRETVATVESLFKTRI
ncbi:MAG TPA: hypothetical protein VFZ52_25155 [Chryseolinea sp.]